MTWRRVLIGLLAVVLAPSAEAAEFHFSRLNRTQEAAEVVAAPTEWGPFRVHLRARDARLTVLSQRLDLTPLADGSHQARLMTQAEGQGTLLAKVEALGLGTEQSDQVSAPVQGHDLTGRIWVHRQPDRYRVTVAELPRQVTVQVNSQLGARLVGWCEGMPLLAALGGDCGGLRRALSSVTVPLPRPGETYDVLRSELTAEELKSLDKYLAAAPTPR